MASASVPSSNSCAADCYCVAVPKEDTTPPPSGNRGPANTMLHKLAEDMGIKF